MAFIFGKQKTPKEILREHQRNLNRSIREIEKETNNLKNQEKKIIIDIKKNAKDGQMVFFFKFSFFFSFLISILNLSQKLFCRVQLKLWQKI